VPTGRENTHVDTHANNTQEQSGVLFTTAELWESLITKRVAGNNSLLGKLPLTSFCSNTTAGWQVHESEGR